jgi:hypothetical protein
MKRYLGLCGGLVLITSIVAAVYCYQTRSTCAATEEGAERNVAPEEQPSAAPAAPTTGADARLRRLALGTWQDEYQGKRTLVLKEDGTGSMVVELSGMAATLFAPRLQFDIEWSIENGRFKERSLGGQPERQVQLILKTMGDRVDQPILELTDERMLLLDADGKTKYDWRRPK